ATVGGGGAGAALVAEAAAGADGSLFIAAGGGGGGGIGRIRINQAASCAQPGTYSPACSVSCSGCGSCPSAPPLGCQALDDSGRLYYRCDSALGFQNARARCQAVGLDLTDISDSAENGWLRGQLSKESWIG